MRCATAVFAAAALLETDTARQGMTPAGVTDDDRKAGLDQCVDLLIVLPRVHNEQPVDLVCRHQVQVCIRAGRVLNGVNQKIEVMLVAHFVEAVQELGNERVHTDVLSGRQDKAERMALAACQSPARSVPHVAQFSNGLEHAFTRLFGDGDLLLFVHDEGDRCRRNPCFVGHILHGDLGFAHLFLPPNSNRHHDLKKDLTSPVSVHIMSLHY